LTIKYKNTTKKATQVKRRRILPKALSPSPLKASKIKLLSQIFQ